MKARIVWGLVFLAVLALAALFWTTPVDNRIGSAAGDGASIDACATDPSAAGCL